jgi:hypothetical protein
MNRIEGIPGNNDRVGSNKIHLARLSPDIPDYCPVTTNDILDYLIKVLPAEISLKVDDLKFIRTARVCKESYWVWEFIGGSGTGCFVSVDGMGVIRHSEHSGDLTVEQYLVEAQVQAEKEKREVWIAYAARDYLQATKKTKSSSGDLWMQRINCVLQFTGF